MTGGHFSLMNNDRGSIFYGGHFTSFHRYYAVVLAIILIQEQTTLRYLGYIGTHAGEVTLSFSFLLFFEVVNN